MSWDVHTGMWAVLGCWTMTENVLSFQNWPLFLVGFFTGCLDFSSSFCAICEHFKIVNIFIFTTFLWGGVGTPRYTDLRGYRLMSPSFSANISIPWFPLPLSHHSLTPQLCQFQCCVGNKSQNTSRVKIAEKERERERKMNSRTWTDILHVHPKPMQQNLFSSDSICLSGSINNFYLDFT